MEIQISKKKIKGNIAKSIGCNIQTDNKKMVY